MPQQLEISQLQHFFFLLLPFNVFCLQLAPVPERAPAQHTTHSPVRRASRCERERTRVSERHRETAKERTWRGNRRRVEPNKVRYFTPVTGADHGHFVKTHMCTTLRHWSHSLIVIHSGHPDHEPTTSRLPVRNGALALQVEQGPSHGETPP